MKSKYKLNFSCTSTHVYFGLLLLFILMCAYGASKTEYMGTMRTATGPNGNSAAVISGPNGNTVVATSTSSSSSSYYPNEGIPASQIPSGQEDLYILKSAIVPPVCPACPACPKQTSCSKEPPPPCPACARCPKQPFKCKKVPDYSSPAVKEKLPMPYLNDFSAF